MRRIIVALAVGLLPWTVPAAEAAVGEALDLATALAATYHDNPALAAARAQLRAVDEGLPLARTSRRPRLAASSGYSLGRDEDSDGGRNVGTFRNALTLEQPLYTGGESTALIGRAAQLVDAERARLEATEQSVLLAAVEAFTAVLRDRRVEDIARLNEARLQAQLEAVKRRFRFGGVTRTDVAQAESRLARGVADREAAEGRVRESAAVYRRVIGSWPPALVEPATPIDLPPDEAVAQERAAENPALRAALSDLEAARRDVAVSQAALRPRLSLTGSASYVDDPSGTLDWESELAVGAVLSIPLYQGGGEFARVRQSRQAFAEQRYRVDEVRRAVEAAVGIAWQELATTRARRLSLELQVEAASLALDGVRQESMVGARTVLDVLDAEQELFEAESALVAAGRDSLVAAYRLKAATGELTAAMLGLDVVPYDPKEYHNAVERAWIGTGEPIER